MRMYTRMNSIQHIREKVMGLKQKPFAEIAGVSQATVSRWETGELEPDRDNMERIRSAAIERGLELDYASFFKAPPNDDAAPQAEAAE
jgi:transcriptional regulator with XRE-family HTH domain